MSGSGDKQRILTSDNASRLEHQPRTTTTSNDLQGQAFVTTPTTMPGFNIQENPTWSGGTSVSTPCLRCAIQRTMCDRKRPSCSQCESDKVRCYYRPLTEQTTHESNLDVPNAVEDLRQAVETLRREKEDLEKDNENLQAKVEQQEELVQQLMNMWRDRNDKIDMLETERIRQGFEPLQTMEARHREIVTTLHAENQDLHRRVEALRAIRTERQHVPTSSWTEENEKLRRENDSLVNQNNYLQHLSTSQMKEIEKLQTAKERPENDSQKHQQTAWSPVEGVSLPRDWSANTPQRDHGSETSGEQMQPDEETITTQEPADVGEGHQGTQEHLMEEIRSLKKYRIWYQDGSKAERERHEELNMALEQLRVENESCLRALEVAQRERDEWWAMAVYRREEVEEMTTENLALYAEVDSVNDTNLALERRIQELQEQLSSLQ